MNIITVTGIRPDFIRMSEVFRALDSDPSINHILIHTGQHYDKLLSGVFFQELNIREPDYNLEIGGSGKEHFHQNAELTVKLIELIRSEAIFEERGYQRGAYRGWHEVWRSKDAGRDK